MKRFTETEKWRDGWFRKLPPDQKLAYLHAIDSCDACGVWEADYELAEFMLGCKPNWPELLASLGDRVKTIQGGKWFFTRFIAFQYGELSEDCKPHLAVFRCLKSNGLLKEYSKGIYTLEEKEKEKEKNKDKDKTEAQLKAEALFNKRPTTPWDAKERKGWETNRRVVEATTQEEWDLLKRFYAAPDTKEHPLYRRRDLATLLNNWSAEITRARDWDRNTSAYANAF